MRNAFAQAFAAATDLDSRLRLIVADISPAGEMTEFRERHPESFLNVGIAEQSMIGIAAGLAQGGLKPFCYTIATFALFRPFEFVRNDICYQNVPVTIVGIGAGLCYSMLGATHHAREDIALAALLPNMQIIAPCDPQETAEATRWLAEHNTEPAYLRLGKAGEPELTAKAPAWEFGRLRRLRFVPGKICVLSYGPIVSRALELADRLDATVYNVHTLKPLDMIALENIVRTYDRVIVIEESVPFLGPIMKALEYDIYAVRMCHITTFALPDEFAHTYGTRDELLDASGLAVEDMLKVCQ